MLWFLGRRVLQGAIVIVAVTLTVFLVTRVLADPVRMMLPPDATVAQEEALRATFGLDRPILEQLMEFLRGAFTLDLGESLWQRQPVLDLVLERIPATFRLIAVGTGLGVLLFVPLGVLASLRPGTKSDKLLTGFSLAGLSMPQFWLGAMLILLFAVQLRWLPTSGSGSWEHLILPGLTLAVTTGGRLAMITRASMIEELEKPYIARVRARGLSEFRVVVVHALRNALVPIVTLAGWETAYGLAGYAVVVETVFGYPGLGQLAINSIRFRDLALLQGVVFVAATIVVVINLLTDLLYKRIDPRVQLN